MPELPEVETVCRGLRLKLPGRKIKALSLHRDALRFPIPKNMTHAVIDQKVTSIDRHSKYIVIHLSDQSRILIHLGMSGRLFFVDPKTYERSKHDHVVFTFDRGVMLVFNDARRFGVLDYLKPGQVSHKLLETVGIDPFDKALTTDYLYDKIRTRSADMKAILMDQKLIAGLGNIYVSEALFGAKIHPLRKGKDMTPAECKKLVASIRKVLTAAIDAGGSSLRDYVQADGELGYFQSKFKVYGREDKPCPVCKTPVERIVQSNRSTYFCPDCQKI